MKKKLIGFILGAAVAAQGAAAFAADSKDVSVFVDNRTVYFADQAPVIKDDRVLVPLRGVIEAMGAVVRWDSEARQAIVTSQDNRTRLVLTIDSTDIRKVTYVTITDINTENVTTDVAPIIMNDRTMIPLRVISENMGADVIWSDEASSVTITTKQLKNAYENAAPAEGQTAEEALSEKNVKISISTDAETVKKGDTVTLKVNLSNLAAADGAAYIGGSVTVYYDAESFIYTGYKTFVNGVAADTYAGADNSAFKGDSVKVAYVMNPTEQLNTEDGTVLELSFVAESDNGGSFTLSDRITDIGNDVSLTLSKDGKTLALSTAEELTIDTTPVEITVSAVAAADSEPVLEESEESEETETDPLLEAALEAAQDTISEPKFEEEFTEEPMLEEDTITEEE